jgi:hypothetical protein
MFSWLEILAARLLQHVIARREGNQSVHFSRKFGDILVKWKV